MNLFTTFYKDTNQQRFDEIKFCLNKNLKVFDLIYIITEDKSVIEPYFKELSISGFYSPKIKVVLTENRPTFNTFFDAMSASEYENSINVIANSDIFFTEKVETSMNTVLALSRWDYFPDGSSVHFDRADSQDVWVFYGKPKIRTSIEFSMGVAGCDNRLAYEIQQSGYNVINPSKSIKTFHFHTSNVRNYIVNGEVKERVPPPYLLINTQF